jgi:PPE-repeat protein
MNFATIPPEINSGRMFDGPGSGSMIEAVTAWEKLAIRLCTAAADYRGVTSKQAVRQGGPELTAMAGATAPYIEWLDGAAALAQHAAAQARAAATAYDTALAAMVPPSMIADNRGRRKSLAKNNCLGQASQAIAAIEACYERMWVRDVVAMYAYAGAAADASTITPFTSPPAPDEGASAPRTWVLRSAPELVCAGHTVMTAIPDALQQFSSSPRAALDACLSKVTPSLSKLSSLSAPTGFAINYLNHLNKAAALRWLLPDQGGARGPEVTARFGRATSIATLSVPQAWASGAAAGAAGAAVRAG